ncbi:MAG: hypothetical protein C4551_07235 [Bacillota bacterium]|nr:MAG: hypothetical protein C4551_07235 [Bacillota bacterium]
MSGKPMSGKPMSGEPYSNTLVGYVPECRKAELRFTVSAVLANSVKGRNLKLVEPPTRAVPAGAVVEMVCTTESVRPGQLVRDVAYLCFAEATESGVLVTGDRIRAGELRGVVLGFNEAHAPNHINVVIGATQAASGRSLGFEPGDLIVVEARDYDDSCL